jgi:proteic killer suppression protein
MIKRRDAIASCIDTRYGGKSDQVVQDDGLERFFKTGSKAGIQRAHASKLESQLLALDEAEMPSAMNLPGWNLHPLHGELAGRWAVKVNGNWRMTFRFEGENAVLVDYQDYHYEKTYADAQSTPSRQDHQGSAGEHSDERNCLCRAYWRLAGCVVACTQWAGGHYRGDVD